MMKHTFRIKNTLAPLIRTRVALPLASLCFLTSACGMATFDGEADLLQLQVIHPDSTIASSLGSLLAEGTQVQMRAIIKDGKKTATMNAVSSDDKSIININSFDKNQVTFDAIKAGFSDIQLKVTGPDSEVLEDMIPLVVRKVESTVVTHPCKDAVFLTQGTVDMPYSMRDENDKRLTGYGFYPLSFEPAGPTIDKDYKFVEHIRVKTGTTPGSFALTSTLPTRDLAIEVIEPAEITKFTDINHDPEADPTILAIDSGASPVATFAIEAGDKSVCGDSEHLVVSSSTPDICTAQLKALGSLYFLTVTPLKSGDCTLDVQLLDTDKTVLQNEQHIVSITP